MNQNQFPLVENGIVIFRGYGSLRVTGWERAEVSVITGYFSIEPDEAGVRIKAIESCDLFVPSGARLVIERVGGDLSAANLTGSLMVERVSGDASFFQVGAVQVSKIGGDCTVRTAAGSFSAEKVGGSLTGSDLTCGLIAGKVGGDLKVANLRGSLEARTGGDLRVGLLDTSLPAITARAGGDLALFLPSGAQARFGVDSGGEDIRVNLGGQQQRIAQRETIVTAGEGGTTGSLRAGGSVTISDQPNNVAPAEDETFSRMEERIGARIRSRMQRLDQMLPDLNQRASQVAQDALRQAEQRIHRAMQQVERNIPPVPPVPPVPQRPETPVVPLWKVEPSAPSDWVADEERLIILRMLQEKKITVEQADALMEALDSSQES